MSLSGLDTKKETLNRVPQNIWSEGCLVTLNDPISLTKEKKEEVWVILITFFSVSLDYLEISCGVWWKYQFSRNFTHDVEDFEDERNNPNITHLKVNLDLRFLLKQHCNTATCCKKLEKQHYNFYKLCPFNISRAFKINFSIHRSLADI